MSADPAPAPAPAAAPRRQRGRFIKALAAFGLIAGLFFFGLAVLVCIEGWRVKGAMVCSPFHVLGISSQVWTDCVSPWLSHPLLSPEDVEWAGLAGALATVGVGLLTAATLAYAALQLRFTADDRRLAQQAAYVTALSTHLSNSRTRLETLIRGSQIDLDRQIPLSYDETERARVIRQFTAGIAPEHEPLVRSIIEQWFNASRQHETALAEWQALTARGEATR